MIEHDTQPIGFRIEWGEKTLSVSAAQVYDHREEGNENIGTVIVFRDFTHRSPPGDSPDHHLLRKTPPATKQ